MAVSKQLDKILKGKLWKFFGGIRPDEKKQTGSCAIESLGIPSLITLPLDRHLGPDGEILVAAGEYVKAGQPLTRPGKGRLVPLHATTSGHIVSISMQMLPHPSGFSGRSIVIKPDGQDTHVDPQPIKDWDRLPPETLLERIRLYGVEGLGGAQFQTAAKLSAAIVDGRRCQIFIVNGCECEPVATCDDRLMQEKAADIVTGIEVIRQILKPEICLIAIEDNKPEAIRAMQKALEGHTGTQLRVIPTVYPSGAARNLIKILTGIEIPYAEHTSECGIVVDNVETVFAVKEAVVDGLPLIGRVITVDGGTLRRRGNAYVRLGTSVRYVLNAFKLLPERHQRVILGGPFMGFTVPSIDVPITKAVTCVYTPDSREVPPAGEAQNCIRCGRCARVCPSRLAPYQLYALSRASRHKETLACGMTDCTECGCCAYVCPSRIPLTGQFRKEKAILALIRDNEKRTARAKERMEARAIRLAEEARIREEKKKAALARIAAQKKAKEAGSSASETASKDSEHEARKAAALTAARERAAARKAGVNAAPASGEKTNASPAERAREIISRDHRLRQGSEDRPRDPLPYALRRGGVDKKSGLDPAWPAPRPQDGSTPGKVENPPSAPYTPPAPKPHAHAYFEEGPRIVPLPDSLKKRP